MGTWSNRHFVALEKSQGGMIDHVVSSGPQNDNAATAQVSTDLRVSNAKYTDTTVMSARIIM